MYEVRFTRQLGDTSVHTQLKREGSQANIWGPIYNSAFFLPGVQMVPISWCEMQCPKTHTKEFRKVARVQPEFLQT